MLLTESELQTLSGKVKPSAQVRWLKAEKIAHIIGLAWLAIPAEITLTEAQAERVFDAFGAWRKQPEAA